MKTLLWITLLLLALLVTEAFAACTTHTYFLPDGRMIVCSTCCFGGGNCTTTCY